MLCYYNLEIDLYSRMKLDATRSVNLGFFLLLMTVANHADS